MQNLTIGGGERGKAWEGGHLLHVICTTLWHRLSSEIAFEGPVSTTANRVTRARYIYHISLR